MNLVPSPVASVFPVVIMDGRPGRKVVGQHPPRAAGTHQIQDGVNHLTQISAARSSARFGWWQQGFNQFPLLIRQIAWVIFSVHISVIGQNTAFHTLSKICNVIWEIADYNSIETIDAVQVNVLF